MYETKTNICIVLLCVACVTALVPATAAGSSPSDDDTDTYVVTQGDQQIEIEPVGDGSQPVEEFYDYRTPETHSYPDYLYSSYGTTEYQSDDTSTLMLYEGTDGLSLVLVHDRLEGDTRGGSITMQMEGLPEEGEWVIEDDTYSEDHYGGRLDQFDHDGTSSRITWIWSHGRTDGGAFNGGLDDDFEITIEPYFNEEADFRYEVPEGYDGQVDEWQVISGAGDSHTSTSLERIDEPITIEPGGVPELSVSSVTASPSSVEPGEEIEVRSAVTNVGNADGTFEINVTVDGHPVDEKELSLDAGETDQLSGTITVDEEGTYEIGVENMTTSMQVTEDANEGTQTNDGNGTETTNSSTEAQSEDDTVPGFGVLIAAFGIGLVMAVSARTARRKR